MKMRLYSPLKGQMWIDDIGYDEEDSAYVYEYEWDNIDGSILDLYQSEITDTIKAYSMDETEKGLMEYYFECDSNNELEQSVAKKIYSAIPMVISCEEILYGVVELEIEDTLTSDEVESIKKYITGQYSDGWGEGFEQQKIKIVEGRLFVSFWKPDNFYIKTQDEFETMLSQKCKSSLNISM